MWTVRRTDMTKSVVAFCNSANAPKTHCCMNVNFRFGKLNLTPRTGQKAQTGSRCIALLFLYPRRQMGVSGQRHVPPLYARERPDTHCLGGLGVPRQVWTGSDNLASTGIRTPDRPARRESLYRPPLIFVFIVICNNNWCQASEIWFGDGLATYLNLQVPCILYIGQT